MSRKRSIQVNEVAGGGADKSVEIDVRKDGTIDYVLTRFYAGATDDLHVNIYRERSETDSKKKIIDTPGENKFISGNDDPFEFYPEIPVKAEDTVIIEYNNIDQNTAIPFKINMEFNREGGTKSSIKALLQRVF